MLLLSHIFSSYKDEYVVIEHAECYNDGGGMDSELKDAKYKCSFEQTCIGIQDHDCMGQSFQQCKKSFSTSSKKINSCFHKKQEMIGIDIIHVNLLFIDPYIIYLSFFLYESNV